MTSEQALKKLTPAQRQRFDELKAAGDRAILYVNRRQRRSADVLVAMGWAETVPGAGFDRYRLTDLGKLIDGPIAFTPSRGEDQK